MIFNERPSRILTTALGFALLPLSTGLIDLNLPAEAQGSPVPGAASYSNYNPYQPAAGGGTSHAAASAPVPGAGYAQASGASSGGPTDAAGAAASGKAGSRTKYQDLPLTADSAKCRLDELRALLSVSRPQDVQGSIQELCEWLNDAADAHYRMFLSFSKSDLTRPQANSEKALNLKFGQLKREAQLLRADLLIKQLRAPEALGPLVDIVAADPRSATGQAAYKRLVDLGFSNAAAAPAAATAVPPASTATQLPAMIPAVAPTAAAAPSPAPAHNFKTQASKPPLKALH
ncbi:MAG: hypothetical protein KGS72_03525 [Cyanobacteria bacterium REEB67]|nr:hypothetical protein [Cyanobacteria bacterium REEB67]